MKVRPAHLLLTAFLFLLIGLTNAQDGFIQLRFTATEVAGKVFLDWTMDLGQTCNGIDITRATDGLNFEPIGNILGVCGSPFDTVRYSFTDESPIPNEVNSYRLQLGNLGPSQTLSVEIISVRGTGFQARPNPIANRGKIYFSNDLNEEHIITLYSIFGKAVFRENGRNDYFEIDGNRLGDGTYIFKIEDAEGLKVVSGKVVVAD